MGSSGTQREIADMDKKGDRHYEASNKLLFPPDVAEALMAAMKANELSPEQAAEKIGIPLSAVILICKGGSPKGSRKIKAKVKAWLASSEGK
ncbi:MAG: hypothetical protein RDV48_17675 [Candidatus Eremiobacteraeota bacterium]|nr:hypothetical protein [Candidatus Eremiobacteraeota bacterium]